MCRQGLAHTEDCHCETGPQSSTVLPPLQRSQNAATLQEQLLGNTEDLPHLFSATVRVYSLVAPCRLPDLTSLALLGSVSVQPGLSRGPLPGYERVSKWRLQLQDSTPFLLLSQRFCTTLHTSASLGCYLLFTHMPDCPLASLGQV